MPYGVTDLPDIGTQPTRSSEQRGITGHTTRGYHFADLLGVD